MHPRRYRVVLSSWAEGDRDAIYEHGLDDWGEAQADEYLRVLRQALEDLATYPEMGRIRGELGAGVRGIPVRRHVIYYMIEGEDVLVGRILHARQDASAVSGIQR